MINLNEVKTGTGVSIFNGGNAGVARATFKEIIKKQPSDSDGSPDFKLIFKDDQGEVNYAMYIPTDDTKAADSLGILMHVGRAVMGADYQFPEVSSYKEAYSTVLSLVKKHGLGQEFNVFVCFGYTKKPSIYLGMRRYNFLENGSVELKDSKLRPSNTDVMVRPQPDNGGQINNEESLEKLGESLTEDNDSLFGDL